MTSTVAPPRRTPQVPLGARRFGRVVAVAVNLVLLWVVANLVAWDWPPFLTDAFVEVEGLVMLSLVVGAVVNAGFVVMDRGRWRALGDLATSVVGVVAAWRVWQVFPFDFGTGTDWTWLVRLLLLVGIVGSAIAIVVNLVGLVTGRAGPPAD